MQNDASLREKSGVSPELRFPECFNQTEIDPRTKRRTVPMEVICIGMMRTGTMCKSSILLFKTFLWPFVLTVDPFLLQLSRSPSKNLATITSTT